MSNALRYRQSAFEVVPAWRRWWPLAVAEFRTLFRTKGGVAVYCVCLLPGVVRLVILLVLFGVLNLGGGGIRAGAGQRARGVLEPASLDFYLRPALDVMPGMVVALLLTSLVTARAIARDRGTNALELYWTRGITPIGYLFAKWSGCCALFATLTVGVPFVLWCVACLFAEDATPYVQLAPSIARGLLGTLTATATWTAVCVFLSAVCATPSLAMVAWSTLVVGTDAVGFVFAKLLAAPWLSSLGLWNAGAVLARAIAGVSQRDASLVTAVITLGVATIGIGALAQRRIRLSEAVG
ncbi:MAG: hypothetical protein JNK78_14025 [Planctomycetes bacterium]|nr:hypothetical protein [Planctomycetota bacterium]